MTKFGQELIISAKEAAEIAAGAKKPARAFYPKPLDVAAIRMRLGLTQDAFAEKFGLTPAMVRDWEQKRRNPDRAARTLLTLIDRDPETIARTLEAA